MVGVIRVMKKNFDIKRVLFVVSLIVIGFVILDIPHGFVPVMFADSPVYLKSQLQEGIVPIYPLFIAINKLIFPDEWYLQIVVIEQILFAIAASTFVVLFLKKKFCVTYLETYLFYFLTFVPYAVFLPEATSCRMIATEALAYPLFYFLMIATMKSVWTGKIRWILCTIAVALIMALTRTQLQLVLLIPAGIFMFSWIRTKAYGNEWKLVTKVLVGVLGTVLVFLTVFGLYKPSNLFWRNVLDKTNLVQHHREYSEETDFEKNMGTDNNLDSYAHNKNISSQYNSVIFTKVMLAALEEDQSLFEEADMRDAYVYVYGKLAEEKKILATMDKNLYIGDSIQGALGGMLRDVNEYLLEFVELYPEKNIAGAMGQFGAQLSKAHPFRWIIGCILQIPSGLISSVFFHKREIYWFSYLVTLMVYGIAVCALLFHRKKYRKDVERRDFLLVAILINLLFVAATSIVFMDLQRYVTYGFGVFYISLYLVMKHIIVSIWSEKFQCKKCP